MKEYTEDLIQELNRKKTSLEELIETIDNYYLNAPGFNSTFAEGIHNRTLDTVELYFYGDRERNY